MNNAIGPRDMTRIAKALECIARELKKMNDRIRCGDCKHFREEFGCCTADQWDYSQTEYPKVEKDCFCSFAERGRE